jgi:hypothetical protein
VVPVLESSFESHNNSKVAAHTYTGGKDLATFIFDLSCVWFEEHLLFLLLSLGRKYTVRAELGLCGGSLC